MVGSQVLEAPVPRVAGVKFKFKKKTERERERELGDGFAIVKRHILILSVRSLI